MNRSILPCLMAIITWVAASWTSCLCATDIVGDGNIYTTNMGATRVGFLNPGGSSSPTTYFGMWYDASNNRGVIEALSGGVAWRTLALNSSGKQPVYIGGALGVGIPAPLVPLHVVGGAANEVARFQARTDASNNRSFMSLYNTNPNFWWEFSAQDAAGNATTNGLAIRERSNAASVERMFLASGGDIGIGTTSPASLGSGGNPRILQIHGTLGAQPYGLLELSSSTAVVGNPTGSVDFGVVGPGRTAAIQSVCTNATSLAGYLDVFTANTGTLTNRARFSDLGIDIHETTQGIGGLGINNDSGAFLRLMPNMISGNYNAMVQTGDTALVFSQGSLDSGTIVIGPHSTAVKGLRMTAAGNVGIGVINPTSALAVNGTISAKEIKVVASPADYVFADSYRLRPLAEVEAFITANKHLPGVPSAKEQEEQGEMVADLMRAHLEKIEEQALYIIALDKQRRQAQVALERSNQRIAALEQNVATLIDRLDRLERAGK